MRVINHKLLKDWIIQHSDHDLTKLVHKSKCSYSFIHKVIRGKYTSEPKLQTRLDICAATGLSEDELFPKKEKI